MTNKERMDRAFGGWWLVHGREFASTPVPDERLRLHIARIAFDAGWKHRGIENQVTSSSEGVATNE